MTDDFKDQLLRAAGLPTQAEADATLTEQTRRTQAWNAGAEDRKGWTAEFNGKTATVVKDCAGTFSEVLKAKRLFIDLRVARGHDHPLTFVAGYENYVLDLPQRTIFQGQDSPRAGGGMPPSNYKGLLQIQLYADNGHPEVAFRIMRQGGKADDKRVALGELTDSRIQAAYVDLMKLVSE